MPASTFPSWAPLLPAALAGTRRQPLVPLPGLTPTLGGEADAAEKQLLLTAANLRLVQRAGQRPQPGPADNLGRAAAETRPPLPPAGRLVLRPVLLDDQLARVEGWCLRLVAAHGYRLAYRDLAALVKTRPNWHYDLRRRSDQLAGQRGEWLHGVQESDLADPPPAEPDPAPEPPVAGWPGYTLERLRTQRPPGGWQWLLTELTTRRDEYAYFQELLYVLREWQRQGPVPASFAPLLEELLPTYRHGDWAAEALALLPGNALVERHWQRVQAVLGYQPGAGRLAVALPVWHESWAPDQIRQLFWSSRRDEHEHLLALLGWLPPARWLAAWQLTAGQAITLAAASDYGHLVLAGWLAGAYRHGDLAFLRALLSHTARQPRPFIEAYPHGNPLTAYLAALPGPAQAAWLHELLPGLPLPLASADEAGNLNIRFEWLEQLSQDAPPVLVQLMQPFLRRWLELPPTPVPYCEYHLARLLTHGLAREADPALLHWLEAELLPLARQQPGRELARAVHEAHRLLTARYQLAAVLGPVAGQQT